MKEVKDFLRLVCLILKEQKLQKKLIKHQSKMADFYIKNNEEIYKHSDTKQLRERLRKRIYEIKVK